MLIGREGECARIEAVLDRARLGRSGALVVRGEAGIGKTALVQHAVRRAEDMTAVRATGIETESEIEFSGLLELCRPLLHLLDGIPERQAEVLRGTLGLGPSAARDPFAVGAATLSLLAAAADERPLLVVVDDAQWLDRASADAVRFAARRLDADRVSLLFAVRDDEPGSADWGGFEEICLLGLGLEDARLLVAQAAGVEIADDVLERVHGATRGSPLALLEVSAMLEPGQLEGRVAIREPLPAGESIRRAFLRRAELLPEDTQRALGVAAVATGSDLAPIASALERMRLDLATLVPAEDAGLVSITSAGLRFEHPLVRAAVYEARPASERREAHLALADAYGRLGDPERRARHLAAGTLGHDEAAAAEVEAAAVRASERTAHVAASEAFEQAALLTPPGRTRCERLASAAEAAWNGGVHQRSASLVAAALDDCDDAALRARLLLLEGRLDLQAGTLERARDLFLEASAGFEPFDRLQAVATLDLAVWMCHFLGDGAQALELARRAHTLARGAGNDLERHADYILGRALVRAGRAAEGAPHLERAVAALAARTQPSRLDLVRAATMLALLERFADSVELVERVTALARDDGPTALTYALSQSSHFRGARGDWRRAESDAHEAAALAGALGLRNIRADSLAVLVRLEARRGSEEACRQHAEEAAAIFDSAGMLSTKLQLECSLGLLELGLDRLDAAVARLAHASNEVIAIGIVERDVTPTPDLVEALVRLGRVDEAEERLRTWATDAMDWPWAPQLVMRCRGLLAPDDELDGAFGEALDLHGGEDDPFPRARTLLCYGERLRRAGRRREARERLREAESVFDELGATVWSDRARRELRASGERLRRREIHEEERLTPQELQIALQVAEGKSNKEVGAALFLSHKTVEFHLGRIYRKLDIHSRAELIRRISAGGPEALEPA